MQTKERNKMRVTGKPSQAKPARPKKEPEIQVQYTPAKPFNRNRFLLHMATVLAVVIAVVLVVSIFFKVDQVLVSGAEKYTPWEIKEAAGIRDGDALLGLSEAKITARIQKKLPYVGDVRVGIKLPDTVNIEIKELDVVYAAEDTSGAWWLMDASGKLVEKISASAAKGYTQILGVRLNNPEIGQQAVAEEPEPDQTDEAGQTVPVTVRGSERLAAVISILQYLEENGVIGQAASLDVTSLKDIQLWYEDRYQVLLGDTTRLSFKIQSMKQAIDQQKHYQTGIMDVSFTIWPDEVNLSQFPK